MYCPKCGTQNVEGAKFCRSCGADIVAVLEQLTGHVAPPEATTESRARRTDKLGAPARPTRAQDDEEIDDDDESRALMLDWKSRTPRRAPRAPMAMPGMWMGPWGWHGRHGRRESKVEDGIQSLFWGIGMLCVAIAIGLFMPGGATWWFWMLLPAFGFIGGGVSEIVRARNTARTVDGASVNRQVDANAPHELAETRFASPTTQIQHTPAASAFPPHETAEIPQPPASVTEGTTRHLDAKTSSAPDTEATRWRRE